MDIDIDDILQCGPSDSPPNPQFGTQGTMWIHNTYDIWQIAASMDKLKHVIKMLTLNFDITRKNFELGFFGYFFYNVE